MNKFVQIGKFIEQVRGVAYGKAEVSDKPVIDYIPVLRSNNIQNGKIDLSELVYVIPDRIKERQLLRKGDILMTASTGSKNIIGKNAYCNKNYMASFGAFCKVIRPKDIFPEYLKHMFQSPQFFNYIQNVVTGANINNIKNSHIDEFKIPLPPLPIQEKIASILDDAAALRDKTEQLLTEYDLLAQSIFLEMFGDPVINPKGWEEVKLNDVGSLNRGKSKHRPRNAPELLGGNYPLIQTGDVANSGGYIREYSSTYSELGLAQSKMWPKGTLCITIAANIAKTGILTFDACFPDSIVAFQPNEKTNNEFVQSWFSFLQKIIEEKAPAVAQKNINLKILRNLDFYCPPLNLQNEFAEKVRLIERQKKIVRQELKESEDLFQALLQQAFKGELV